MGLQYKNMYAKTDTDALLRENLYKEKTSVLAYYVIKLILLAHYQEFMCWCNKHNTSLLQFKKTSNNPVNSRILIMNLSIFNFLCKVL